MIGNIGKKGRNKNKMWKKNKIKYETERERRYRKGK